MKSWTEWTPRELARMKALCRRGYTNAQIAKRLQRPVQSVALLVNRDERRETRGEETK